jgi:hypothetical protein
MKIRRLLITLLSLSLSCAGIGCQSVATSHLDMSPQPADLHASGGEDSILPAAHNHIEYHGCGDHVSGRECQGCGSCHSCEPLIIFVGADRDVFRVGKFPDLASQFRQCGYDAVYFDPREHRDDACLLADWVRSNVRFRGRRVMLVGWSIGAVVCIDALKLLKDEGIGVDTFVELDCLFLKRHVGDRNLATNAARTVVIRSKLNGTPRGYRNACLYRLDTMWHLKVPTMDQTRWILTQEANRVRAATVMNAVPDVPPITD